MKLGIMQPYFFPYLGYFQLMNSVDRFVIYDDVQYVRGWINRNNILEQGKPTYINVELSGVSSRKTILETQVNQAPFWRKKLLKRIRFVYAKAPYFDEVYPLIESCINCEEDLLSVYLTYGLRLIAEQLSINTTIVDSSVPYGNGALSGQERILDTCLKEGADAYINAIGGREIYDGHLFEKAGVDLFFLQPDLCITEDETNTLSIVDVLMRVGLEHGSQLVAGGEPIHYRAFGAEEQRKP